MRQVRLTQKVGARRKDDVVFYDDVSAERLVEAGRAVYVEEPEPFDPGAHTVEEVVEHLATADDAEAHRVLAAERAGKARVGVLGS